MRNYLVMPTEEIAGFLETIDYPIANTAILFLWRLSSMQEDALTVARAWGFRVMSEAVWCKETKEGKRWFGMGRTVRASHETALVCVRGSADDVVVAHNVRSVFDAPVPTYWDGHPDIGSVLLDMAEVDDFVVHNEFDLNPVAALMGDDRLGNDAVFRGQHVKIVATSQRVLIGDA